VSIGTSASATGSGSETVLGLVSGDADIDDKKYQSDNGSRLKIIGGPQLWHAHFYTCRTRQIT
jgi:hypothetical protein